MADERCPHCGYCKHCGRSNAPLVIPYPYPVYPVQPQPSWPSLPYVGDPMPWQSPTITWCQS